MGKKNSEKNFNLSEAENSRDTSVENSNAATVNEGSALTDAAEPGAQMTIFDLVMPESATDNVPEKDMPEEAKATIIEGVGNDDEDDVYIAAMPVDDTIKQEAASKIEASADGYDADEFSIPENITPIEAAEDNFMAGLPEYDAIKDISVHEQFETPYIFNGKNGKRVRYRLTLPSERSPRKNRAKRSFMDWIITIIVAILLAVFLRTFVFVLATVDGPSMLPTLQNNDKLIVTKYSYYLGEIQRGDIVICRYGTAEYPDIYVKRVIGLGGETISISDGVVYIDNVPLEEDYILDAPLHDMEPYFIPLDKVFVMGDNRNNSADSRKSTVGALDKSKIIGKARFRIYPFSSFGPLEDKK